MFPDVNDELAERERIDRRIAGDWPARTDIPFGADPPGMDAEVMDFGTWIGCWRLNWDTGELVAADCRGKARR